jgi:hypothetical protein
MRDKYKVSDSKVKVRACRVIFWFNFEFIIVVLLYYEESGIRSYCQVISTLFPMTLY